MSHNHVMMISCTVFFGNLYYVIHGVGQAHASMCMYVSVLEVMGAIFFYRGCSGLISEPVIIFIDRTSLMDG